MENGRWKMEMENGKSRFSTFSVFGGKASVYLFPMDREIPPFMGDFPIGNKRVFSTSGRKKESGNGKPIYSGFPLPLLLTPCYYAI